MNKVHLMGRLATDPELKTTASGISVTNFTLAVDRNHQKGEDKQTDWIDCVAWRNTAEFICRYFHKGSPIVIEGPIRTHIYEKNDMKIKAVEILVDNAEFVPRSEKLTATGEPREVEKIVPISQGNSTLQAQRVVYEVQQSFSQGSNDDFQQVEMDEDLPF